MRNTVLVADDDASVRESLRKVLHSEGYEVLSAANGTEALELSRREHDRIDLALVDLNMPLKNGWATLDRFTETNPALAVVVVTGQPNQFEMAEAAGVNALVEKPIDVPALLKLIQELLAGSVESGSPVAAIGRFRFTTCARRATRHATCGRNRTSLPTSAGG